jgi:hypothetical protein
VVAHCCNPSYSEGGDPGGCDSRPARAENHRDPSQSTSQCGGNMSVIATLQESEVGGLEAEASPRKK